MKITGLSKSAVMEAAQRAFLGKSLELEEGSLFLRGVEPGAWRCEGIADIQHVSTCMGYHEEIINGNRTRVKTMIPLLFVKESRYAVIIRENSAVMCRWKMKERSRSCPMRSF